MIDPTKKTGTELPIDDLEHISGGADTFAEDGTVIPGTDADIDLKLGKSKLPPILPPIVPPAAEGDAGGTDGGPARTDTMG